MNIQAGEFVRMKARNIAPDSLEERLVVEQYISRLQEILIENNEVCKKVRPLAKNESGVLHDLENVLLRFDAPKKWRDFVRATRDRRGGNIGETLKAFVEGNRQLLPHSDGTLLDNHPVQQAMDTAREDILVMLDDRGLSGEGPSERWTRLLDAVDEEIRSAAAREWLCYSLRRAFFSESTS